MPEIARRALAGAALVCTLVASTPADATILIALDLQELTAESDRIVVGQVVWVEPIQIDSGMIRTRYRVLVEQDLRGSDDRELVVETLGGRIGRLGMRVEGSPSFSLGDRVVVFVERDSDTVFRPVGMAQGVMRVEHEDGRNVVLPMQPDMLLVRPNAQGALVKSAGPLSGREHLDAFLSRVRKIIATQREEVP
jgi:hypothetical protein